METLLEKLFALSKQERDSVIKKMIDILDLSSESLDTPQPPKAKKAPVKKPSGKYDVPAALRPGDMKVFNDLKTWRNQVAKDLEFQPYLVFNNESLTCMAYHKPKTEAELLKIKGVGPEKFGKYGETVLEIINGGNTSSLQNDIQDEVQDELPKKRMLKPNV